MADATTTQDKDTTTAGTTQTDQADDGKGGKQAVLADLATERDKRQALEAQVQQLKDAQSAQTDALAKAFGLKPEETSDVTRLAAQVTALQEQFTTTQRENVVLNVANEYGITDKETIADLSAISDERAMRSLAARLSQAGENSTGRPKPDLTQGGSQSDVKRDPAQEFGDFLKKQLGN